MSDRRERAVPTVIGVVLLVAITVTLATIVGALSMAFDDRLAPPAPYGAFEARYDARTRAPAASRT